MRLIKADALIAQFHRDAMRLGGLEEPWDLSAIETEIESAPTIDAVPVVRCKDCIVSYCVGDEDIVCGRTGVNVDADDFCSYGERKDGDGNG